MHALVYDDPNGYYRMNNLTREERLAINRLKKALTTLPSSLIVYVIDDSAVVCKRGVPSEDIAEDVGRSIRPGLVLTDIHDDMDYGEG